MITWTETRPDFARLPANKLFQQLSFTLVCGLIVRALGEMRVLVNNKSLRGIEQHLAERNIESGGLLLGNVYQLRPGDDNLIVHVETFSRANSFDGTSVSLRMDTSVWDTARLAAKGQCYVVGWYHSHPNLGAFFSGTDRATQRAFFNAPHSLGLVIDPIRQEQKWFLGPGSAELKPRQVLVQSLANVE